VILIRSSDMQAPQPGSSYIGTAATIASSTFYPLANSEIDSGLVTSAAAPTLLP
jgi:hypothetical protein